MNTNFFNQVQQLDFTGVLQLNISKGVESNLIVSVLLNNEQCGDSAKNLILPLIINATLLSLTLHAVKKNKTFISFWVSCFLFFI